MRRCIDELHPDPAFPGCIYSEMKMCLAPCFKGCTDEAYEAEVGRVQAYFDSSGDSLVREIARQRDTASAELEFEQAATLHARVDKLKGVVTQLPEIVHRIDALAAVMVQASATPESVNLFRIDAGCIAVTVSLSIQPADHAKSQSMESRIEEALAPCVPEARTALAAMEHLALLKRWYYRSHRAGEMFFADEKGNLPMRRIVRGVSRIYRGEKPDEGNLNDESQSWVDSSH